MPAGLHLLVFRRAAVNLGATKEEKEGKRRHDKPQRNAVPRLYEPEKKSGEERGAHLLLLTPILSRERKEEEKRAQAFHLFLPLEGEGEGGGRGKGTGPGELGCVSIPTLIFPGKGKEEKRGKGQERGARSLCRTHFSSSFLLFHRRGEKEEGKKEGNTPGHRPSPCLISLYAPCSPPLFHHPFSRGGPCPISNSSNS